MHSLTNHNIITPLNIYNKIQHPNSQSSLTLNTNTRSLDKIHSSVGDTDFEHQTTDPYLIFHLPRTTMSPADKTKTSTKKLSESVAAAPVAPIRTRSTTAPPSLSDFITAIESSINPKIETLTTEFRTHSASIDNRILDLENSIDFIKADSAATTQQIQDQLSLILQRLDRVERENNELRNSPPSATTNPMNSDFPTLGTSASKHATPPTVNLHADSSPQAQPSRKGGLRLFTPVSENQGFQYLYLPLRGRKPFKEIRAELKQAHINSGSVIDIHYPSPKVVALLVHNDFAEKALELLKAENVHPLKHFDPLDHKHLMNPEFKDANIEVRTQQMQMIFDKQINRTLDFLRPPVKLAVARDFQKKGWITSSYLEDLLHLHANTPSHPNSQHHSNALLNKDEDFDIDMDRNKGNQDPNQPQQTQQTQQTQQQQQQQQPQLNQDTPMDFNVDLVNPTTATHSLAGGGEPANSN